MPVPPTNLFPLGRPAGPEDVVDREDFLTDLTQRLSDGHSVMLAAPRRTGKSTVAREALRRLSGEGAYTASVDLFYVTDIEEFGAKLMQQVLANRVGLRGHGVRALRGLREWLGGTELRAKLHDLELGLSLGAETPDPLTLLESAVDMAERVASRDGRRCVVLLDEFQETERLGGDLLLKRLRALFQHQNRTVYLFLGSQTGMMRTIFSDRRQAFYRFATALPLPEIPGDAWRAYLRRRLRQAGLHITAPALDLCLQKTGGHPYCTMAVAYNAYADAVQMGLAEITADTVAMATEKALEMLTSTYEVEWQAVHRNRHADQVFAALATGRPPYSLPLNGGAVSKALQHLIARSLVARGQRRGQYRMVEPLFAEWYRRKAWGDPV